MGRHIASQIMAEEGSVLGMWRGLGVALMTYAPTSGIVWSTYRWTKARLHSKMISKESEMRYAALNFVSGSVSGALAGMLTMPLDTVKIRKQVLAKRSTRSRHIVKAVYNELGVRGFFRGVVSRTCQYTVTCAVIMTVYDWVKRVSKLE